MSNTLTDYEKAKKIMTIEYGIAPTSESEFNNTILQLFNISSGELHSILDGIVQQNIANLTADTSIFSFSPKDYNKWINREYGKSKTIPINPAATEIKPIKCNCDWNDILRYGCKCGGT